MCRKKHITGVHLETKQQISTTFISW